MANPPAFNRETNVRYTPAAKRALGRLLSDLRARDDLAWQGRPLTQEALINASWLLLESLGAERVADLLRPHIAQLEQAVRDRSTAAGVAADSRATPQRGPNPPLIADPESIAQAEPGAA